MELRHLRYFVAVAEELNFSRAADRLGTAQPSLSQQIRQLEEEIGVDLFDRTRRRIALTPAGDEFLSESRALIAQLESAVAHVREVGRGLRGELRIVYAPSAMMSRLPAAIRAFRLDHPEVRINLRGMSRPAALLALRSRDADVGVALAQRDLSEEGEIDVRKVSSLEVMMVVPEGHPLATRASISIEEIGEERLILYARPCECGRPFDSGNGVRPNVQPDRG